MAQRGSMSEEKMTRRLTNPELRCKNKCGFYGNPIYMGYCSKCYKELMQSTSEKPRAQSVIDPTNGKAGAAGNVGIFSRFNNKKRIQSTGKKTLSGRLFGTPLKPTSPPGQWAGVADTIRDSGAGKKAKKGKVVEPFNEFLKTIKKPAAQDIVEHLKMFRKQIADRATATVEEQSEAIQEFYTEMAERIQTHSLFRSMTPEQQGEVLDSIEKHLMTHIYNDVYSPASCDDDMKDLLLQRRIRMLNWVEPKHLDIPLKLELPKVQELISQGRQELCTMDSKKAPQDKLSCISKCCTTLMAALKLSQDGPASADEFLPSLIYMIIYATPQHLHSNTNYISRFSNPARVMSGEAGYYFTNLCGAVSFIENITAEGLCVTEEEFNVKMGYVDGKTDVDLLLAEGLEDQQEDIENLQILKSCSDSLDELTGRLNNLMKELQIHQSQMAEFRVGIREQVDSIFVEPAPTGDLIDLSEQWEHIPRAY